MIFNNSLRALLLTTWVMTLLACGGGGRLAWASPAPDMQDNGFFEGTNPGDYVKPETDSRKRTGLHRVRRVQNPTLNPAPGTPPPALQTSASGAVASLDSADQGAKTGQVADNQERISYSPERRNPFADRRRLFALIDVHRREDSREEEGVYDPRKRELREAKEAPACGLELADGGTITEEPNTFYHVRLTNYGPVYTARFVLVVDPRLGLRVPLDAKVVLVGHDAFVDENGVDRVGPIRYEGPPPAISTPTAYGDDLQSIGSFPFDLKAEHIGVYNRDLIIKGPNEKVLCSSLGKSYEGDSHADYTYKFAVSHNNQVVRRQPAVPRDRRVGGVVTDIH